MQMLLPNKQLVQAHFNRNYANPNVTGPELVRYIKNRLQPGGREDVLVEIRSSDLWVLHLIDDVLQVTTVAGVSSSRVKKGVFEAKDMAALLALADAETNREKRWEYYKRILRPPGLRRLFIRLMGARCMVDSCSASEEFDAAWGAGSGEAIVEVHHVEHVAKRIDHSPRNLCVLCANHHKLLHDNGEWTIKHDGPNIIFSRGVRELKVIRPAALFSTSSR
jgi:predicted HNH restriction endonuclease